MHEDINVGGIHYNSIIAFLLHQMQYSIRMYYLLDNGGWNQQQLSNEAIGFLYHRNIS